MFNTEPLTLVLLVAVAYLFYKVRRLEQQVGSPPSAKRRPVQGSRDAKVIPILKDEIESGPFKTGNRWRKQSKPEQEE